MDRNYYAALRQRFLPRNIKTVFVLESPPVSGKYFYNPNGKTTEALFGAMMKYVLHIQPNTKAEGLAQFQEAGYLLVDATYVQVNHLTDAQRDQIIAQDYPLLTNDLGILLGERRTKTKIILVKAIVCRLLESRLVADGFSIVNAGTTVPFPASGHQRKFEEILRKLI